MLTQKPLRTLSVLTVDGYVYLTPRAATDVLLAAGCPSNLAYHRLARAATDGKIRTVPTGLHSRAYHADDVATFANQYR